MDKCISWCFYWCCFVVVVQQYFYLVLIFMLPFIHIHTTAKSVSKDNDCDTLWMRLCKSNTKILQTISLEKQKKPAEIKTRVECKTKTWEKIHHSKFEACNSLKDGFQWKREWQQQPYTQTHRIMKNGSYINLCKCEDEYTYISSSTIHA